MKLSVSPWRIAFEQAINAANQQFAKGDYHEAFLQLERAHVVGQRHFVSHLRVHLWMLKVGWARRDGREVRGQLLRLLLTPFGHLSGRLPLGNTGGANVSAFARLPIPSELQAILDASTKDATSK